MNMAPSSNDGPPPVLQNMSAVSRQIANSSKDTKQPKKGWGWGKVFGSKKSGTDDKKTNRKKTPPQTGSQAKLVLQQSQAENNSGGYSIQETNSDHTAHLEQSSSSSSVATPTSPRRKTKPQHPSSPQAQSPNPSSIVRNKGGSAESPTKSPKRGKLNNFFRRTLVGGGSNSSNAKKDPSPEQAERDQRRAEMTKESAWLEHDLRERQSFPGTYMSDDDLRALILFDQQRHGSELTIAELDELVTLAKAYREAQKDEAELEVLLERQERGDPDVDTSRMYLLELLTRKRRGEALEEEEEEDLETLLQQRQDEEELELLLTQKENGEDFDEGRLYELDLLHRQSQGDHAMTDEESRDVQLLERRRMDARLDAKDFRALSVRKNNGEIFSVDLADRFVILTLVDRRCREEPLTEEEAQDLNNYYDLRDEEHLDSIELTMLLAKKEKGDESVDEERIYELELLERERQGEDLTDEEVGDLEIFQSRREQQALYANELLELVDKEERGEHVDEHRLKMLRILEKQRRGARLTAEELELLQQQQSLEDSEKEELGNLRKQKERGESVDENRLYELELLNRKRRGEKLSDDELMDHELFQLQRIEERDTVEHLHDDAPVEVGEDEAKSLATLDEVSLTSSEQRGREQLKRDLVDHGLPITITFSPGKRDLLQMSFVSHSDESYIQDIMNQRDNRDEQRKEETLEEALELYQIALKEQNILESEQLFLTIFEQVLKEKTEDAREKDARMDEILDRELKLRELRKHKALDDDSVLSEEAGLVTEENDPTTELAVEARDCLVNAAAVGVSLEQMQPEDKKIVEQQDDGPDVLQGKQANIESSQPGSSAPLKVEEVDDHSRKLNEGDCNIPPEDVQDAPAITEMVQERGSGREGDNDGNGEATDGVPPSHDSPRLEESIVHDGVEPSSSTDISETDGTLPLIDNLGNNPGLEQRNESAFVTPLISESLSLENAEDDTYEKDTSGDNSSQVQIVAKANILNNAKQRLVEKVEAQLEKHARKQTVEDSLTSAVDILLLAKEHNSTVPLELSHSPPIIEAPHLSDVVSGNEQRVNASFVHHDQVDQVSPVLSNLNVALTDGELEEFNSLLDAQELGKAVDEERLYELELVDRYSLGDALNPDERADLCIILKKRDRFQRYTQEYNDLLDSQEAGREIDEARLYCLELVVRKTLGECLTGDELDELEAFENSEEHIYPYTPNNVLLPATGLAISDDDCWNPMKGTEELLNEDGFRKGSEEPLALLEEVEEEDLSDSDVSQPMSQFGSTSLAAKAIEDAETTTEIEHTAQGCSEDYELDQLLSLQQNSEEVDEQRVYELELLQRKRSGENLTPEEVEDSYFFQERKKRFEEYSVEYKDLVKKQEMGELYDVDRLLNLELAIRSGLGESLADDEFDALEDFEMAEDERRHETASGSIDPVPTTVDVKEHPPDKLFSFDLSMDKENESNQDLLALDDPMNLSTDEADWSDEKDHLSLSQENSSSSANLPTDNIRNDGELELPVHVEKEESNLLDRCALSEELRSNQTAEDCTIQSTVEMPLASDELQKPANSNSSDEFIKGQLSRDTDDRSIDETSENESKVEELDASTQKGIAGKDNFYGIDQNGDSMMLKMQISEEVTLKTEATSESGCQTSWDQSSFDTERKDERRALTRLEQEEFVDLMEKQQAGFEFDEERLYELDLLERHGRNETLAPEELEDLDFIKERRQRLDMYHQEFLSMLESMENGEPVNESRFYSLGLIEKRRNFEALTEEEMCAVEDFEVEEEDNHSEIETFINMHESQSFSHSQSIADVIGEARNRALDLLSGDSVAAIEGPASTDIAVKKDPALSLDLLDHSFVETESPDANNSGAEILVVVDSKIREERIEDVNDLQEASEPEAGRVVEEETTKADEQFRRERAESAKNDDSSQEENDTVGVKDAEVPGARMSKQKGRWGSLFAFGLKAEKSKSDTTKVATDEVGTQGATGPKGKPKDETMSHLDEVPLESFAVPETPALVVDDEASAATGEATQCDIESPVAQANNISASKTREFSFVDMGTKNRSQTEGDLFAESINETTQATCAIPDQVDEKEKLCHETESDETGATDNRSLTGSEQLYEDSVFQREERGDVLSDEELFELDLFSRRRNGEVLSAEEINELHLVHERRREERCDELDFKEMEGQLARGETIDEDRHYQVGLRVRFSRGEELTQDESFELYAFDRLQKGEELSFEELEDLELLKEQRANLKLDHEEMLTLKARKESGDNVDEDRLFELVIFDKDRSSAKMNERELYALELLQRLQNGERLSDEEFSDLDHLKSRILEDDATKLNSVFTGELLDYVSDLKLRAETGSVLNEDEMYALELIGRVDKGDRLSNDEMEALKLLRQERHETLELLGLQHRRDNGLEYDEDLLYELELLDFHKQQHPLNDAQAYELELFEKRRLGGQLTEVEVMELETLKRQREERRLDEEDLRELIAQKERGEEVDEDLLYELELFDRMRTDQLLNDKELVEVEMFELIRRGEKLSETQLEQLELLKRERLECIVDEEDLAELRAAQVRGETIDEDFLYELELFQRNRSGEALSNEELYELELFRRRRDGEAILEDDLDELELLKKRRQQLTVSRTGVHGLVVDEATEEEEDSVYRQALLDRQMKGQRLDKQEFQWLEILQKRKRNEELLEDELDELEILRRQRKENTEEVQHTRKLLEKEMKKKQRREQWEQRVQEKEDRREQRRIEKKLRLQTKKMRKKKKPWVLSGQPDAKPAPITPAVPREEVSGEHTPGILATVEIVDLPPTPQIVSKKDEAKKGLFGGVFGGGTKKKSKKELELEEMRRRQEEVIKEQMKALEMENELKELDKEKELQEQLVQETIDKTTSLADDDSGSSSSWETDTNYNPEESESDDDDASSSISSWNSLSSIDESVGNNADTPSGLMDMAAKTRAPDVEETGDADMEQQLDAPKLKAAYSLMLRSKRRQLVERASFGASDVDQKSGTGDTQPDHDSFLPLETVTEQPDLKYAVIPSTDTKGRIGELNIKPVTVAKVENEKKEVRGPLSPKLKSKALSLSAHIKKQQKKRQRNSKRTKGKYGDDLSLGTAQLAKMNKLSQNGEAPAENLNLHAVRKQAGRPWKLNESGIHAEDFAAHESRVKQPHPAPNAKEKIDNKFFSKEAMQVFDRSVFNFNQSTAKLSVGLDDERSQTSLSDGGSLQSAEVKDGATLSNHSKNAEARDLEDQDSMLESLTSSIATFETDAYQFGPPDYDQIGSRLADKLRSKEAEFDATWEDVVPDQNVAAQINQRRRERQRVKGGGKEEKKDDDEVDEVPRLFLFEGEKVEMKRKRKRKKNGRRLQRKLDRTLSKEFRRAMKEVFSSESEAEYDRHFGEGDGEGDDAQGFYQRGGRKVPHPSIDPSVFDDYEEENEGAAKDFNESGSAGTEASNGFDGGYLQRLQERSMQQEVKEMMSESRKLMAQSLHSQYSDDDDEMSHESDMSRHQSLRERGRSPGGSKEHRKSLKLKRNRTGELVGEGVDPADIYALEVEKLKDKKTFTIADLRKEMENLSKQASMPPGGGSAPSDIGAIGGSSQPNKAKSTKLKKPKSVAATKGLGHQRPGIGTRQTSFGTAASEQGLLFGAPSFEMGSQPETIDEVEEEEAFLTGGDGSGEIGGAESKNSGGFGSKLGFSKFNVFGSGGDVGDSHSKSPSRSKRLRSITSGFNVQARVPRFTGGKSPTTVSDLNDLPNGGPLNPSSFQEPLPVPEEQDADHSRSRRGSVLNIMGKGKSFFSTLKLPGKRRPSPEFGGGGFMMDDDDDQPDEGGMGLLG